MVCGNTRGEEARVGSLQGRPLPCMCRTRVHRHHHRCPSGNLAGPPRQGGLPATCPSTPTTNRNVLFFCAPSAPTAGPPRQGGLLPHAQAHARHRRGHDLGGRGCARPALPCALRAPARARCLERGAWRLRGLGARAGASPAPLCAAHLAQTDAVATILSTPLHPTPAAELCKEEPEWREPDQPYLC